MSVRQPKFTREQAREWILDVAQRAHGGHWAPLRPQYDEKRVAKAPTAVTLLKAYGVLEGKEGTAQGWADLCKELTGLDMAKPRPTYARPTARYQPQETPLKLATAAEHGRGLEYTRVTRVQGGEFQRSGDRIHYVGGEVSYMLR